MTKKKSHKKISESLKQNYWISATAVLAILLVASVFTETSCTGAVVSAETAGNNVVQFALDQGTEAELVGVTDTGSLYEVTISISGEETSLYTTYDGENLVPYIYSLAELTEETETTTTTSTTTEIPTSDNPTSQLFIWSYCPYGVTALEPFAQVAQLLGGNMEVVLYYAGHGDYEVQQNKIQACIQELDYTTEYWEYAEIFATEIYEECYGDVDCDLEKSIEAMESVGIDSDAILSCVETNGEALLEAEYAKAQKVGVTGSPSLVVNGVKASVSRTAEAYKEAICSAYNNSPEACGETLDSTAATTTGSC